jgi:diguanylate cyclase (GGDEF)-like protein
MDDSAPPSPKPAVSERRSSSLRRAAAIFCTVSALVGATHFLTGAFFGRRLYTIDLPLPLLTSLALAAALLIVVAIRRYQGHWKGQVVRMRLALEQAVAGELLIEEFDQPFGGLTPLNPVLLELLRERRKHRSEIARLQLEMERRVARRTDAMERVIGKLRAQATRDVLTGLYNRRMLDQCLDELVNRCTQDGAPLCLLMIDVDDFKLLNDTLGHAAGDTLLRAIGQLIRSSIRQQDLAFRCGGDEFLVVLPQSPRAHGEGLARRLSELVDGLVKTLNVARRPRLCFGISMLADLPDEATAPELMKDADRRLYAAKAARKAGGGPQDRAA